MIIWHYSSFVVYIQLHILHCLDANSKLAIVSQSHLSISIPDTDRFWFSFGGNYAFSENSNVDLGVSILRGKTQNFTEEDSFAKALGQEVSWDFESKGHAVLIGAQYNYTF